MGQSSRQFAPIDTHTDKSWGAERPVPVRSPERARIKAVYALTSFTGCCCDAAGAAFDRRRSGERPAQLRVLTLGLGLQLSCQVVASLK